MLEEFQVYHQKDTTYHPQVNGMVEDFNKISENMLTRVCNMQRNEWDMCIPVVLWAYKTIYKKLIGQTPFRLVYGIEALMPMEYIVPNLCIAALIEMEDCETLEEQLTQLMELEEDHFLARFH